MKKRLEIFIIGIVLMSPLIHEFGHFLGYLIDGVPAKVGYGMVNSDRTTILGVALGPLSNILIGIISLILINFSKRYKDIWLIIGLAFTESRLLNEIIIFLIGIFLKPTVLTGNDEGQLGLLLGGNIKLTYICFILINLILVILLLKASKDKCMFKKLSFRIVLYSLIISLGLIFFC